MHSIGRILFAHIAFSGLINKLWQVAKNSWHYHGDRSTSTLFPNGPPTSIFNPYVSSELLPIQQTIWMSLSKSNWTTFPLELLLLPCFCLVNGISICQGVQVGTVIQFQDLISHTQFSSRRCQFCFLHIPQIHLDSSHIPSLAIWTTAVDSLLIPQLFLLQPSLCSVRCNQTELFKDANAITPHTLKPPQPLIANDPVLRLNTKIPYVAYDAPCGLAPVPPNTLCFSHTIP